MNRRNSFQSRMGISGEIGQNHRMQPRNPWNYQDPLLHIFGINYWFSQSEGIKQG